METTTQTLSELETIEKTLPTIEVKNWIARLKEKLATEEVWDVDGKQMTRQINPVKANILINELAGIKLI